MSDYTESLSEVFQSKMQRGIFSAFVPLLAVAFTFFSHPIPVDAADATQCYTWKNVRIGGGGGFVPNIIFNPGEEGVAYARTDIGGAYKLNSDDTWTALTDFVNGTNWNEWGIDGLAVDPVTTGRLYLLTGAYTNSWDTSNGHILRSTDYGSTFDAIALPFKVGGNMPGRGLGERIAVDPNLGSILFLGARSGHGLWKSTDYGSTWTNVTSFPNVGTWAPDSTDTTGYNSDPIGIAFVTFDSTSSSKGTATSRIFVGVVETSSYNIYVSTNGGSTWTAVSGQPTGYIPHKGVLSPSEKVMYVTYTDGAGPYDGTDGSLYKYNITSGVWTDISPGSDRYYGFGGVSVDLQKPGTLMVAALNQWWPDACIWRSTDSGATWSAIWEWNGYPNINYYFSYDITSAPWLYMAPDSGSYYKYVGWMIEGLAINPFDSDHFLYGTGATIYGSKDLTKWDSVHNITLASLATGIEETSIQALLAPASGPKLLSAVGDITGFYHSSLDTAPSAGFTNPYWATSLDLDYAGNVPATVIRVGSDTTGSTKQIAISYDTGSSWSQYYGAVDGVAGGKIALSANADTILWRTSSGSVIVSQYSATFSAVSTLPSTSPVIASDKVNGTVFYAAAGNVFYVSTDTGKTFTQASTYTSSSSSSAVEIAVHPSVAGDVWVSSSTGLFHSTNYGATFTAVSSVSVGYNFALGKSSTTGGYPSIYLVGTVGGTTGVHRTDDKGVNWVQINDSTHGFGAPSSVVVAADQNTYGRVYLGTNGRGIFYGDTSCTKPAATATASLSARSTGIAGRVKL
ncbi:hypothetical protein RUND412_005635 [Rhizina undulata]